MATSDSHQFTSSLLRTTVVLTTLICREDQDVGIGSEGAKSLVLKRGYVATRGEGFGKVCLVDSGQDVQFEEVEGGELRRVSLVWVQGTG